jgi:hypothetical protein
MKTEPQEILAGDKLSAQGLALASLRQLSAGSFEARCGRCQRFSAPVDALGLDHAWSELLKAGWTWYTSPVVGATGYASCLACLRASATPLLRRDLH